MNYFKNLKLNKGFTLTELIVVITIFTAILTALVLNQNSWNQRLALKTASLEIGLVLRQAQINSLAVRESIASSGDKFDVGYGVYFDITNTTSYIYFADLDRDSLYDAGEEISVIPLKNKIVINRLCGAVINNTQYCVNSGSGIQKIVISFRRPDSKANIIFINGAGNSMNGIAPPARIELEYGTSNNVMSVVVQENGQIDS